MRRAYTVASKNGAIVRADVELDSEEVTTLEQGSAVTVDSQGTSASGTARCHIVEPVVGWVSGKTLSAARPRIALLHGTAANATILRVQLAALLKELGAFELVYVEGPRVASDDNAQVATMRKYFGKDQVLRQFGTATLDDRGWRTYEDVGDAADAAQAALDDKFPHRPPDAIVGFSQGANFASILVARYERRQLQVPCCVLMCGARPGWVRQLPSELFATPLATPALLVAAENDAVVGDGPQHMAKLFASPTLLTHPEGHKPLPSADRHLLATLTRRIVDFLHDHTKI